MVQNAAVGAERKWVTLTVTPHSDVRWSIHLSRGKELLRNTLDKRTGNTHWLPTPEELRGYRLGTFDLYRRAEEYFMLRTARAAGAARGLRWILAWRFVDSEGNVLHEDAG